MPTFEKLPEIIYLKNRKISKMSNEQYVIYLPREKNDLWNEIRNNKLRIEIVIKVIK